jgi:hypothetical protein
MKQILFLFFFAAFAAILPTSEVYGQTWVQVSDSTRLTNADTNVVYLLTDSRGKQGIWSYSVHVVSDSISGSTAGTCVLQTSNNGIHWVTAANIYTATSQTLTLNGATQQAALWEGVLYARRIRIYQITSGTQVTSVRIKAFMRKIN